MKSCVAIACLAAALIAGRSAQAETFSMDLRFGTPEEQALWQVGLDTSTGPAGVEFSENLLRLLPDGDFTGIGNAYIDRQFFAPEGMAFANVKFEGIGQGYSSWTKKAQLYMTYENDPTDEPWVEPQNGQAWEIESNAANVGFEDTPMLATTEGVAGYEAVTSIWLRVQIYDIFGFGVAPTHSPFAKDLKFSGELVPAPVVVNADFNNDLVVDGVDFLIWQRGFGLSEQTTNEFGDADANGVIDELDLDAWKLAYGTGAAPEVSAVPEPATWSLVATSLLAGGAVARARRARCQ